MVLLKQGCPVWGFQPRIRFANELLLPAALFGITVPAGLSEHNVPEPTYVTPQRMLELLRSPQQQAVGGGIGVVHGLTKPEFAVRFSDPMQQWRQVSPAGRSPYWQFQGGDVFLEVEIAVYVLEGDRPSEDDPVSRQIFAIILEHELLHVLDEIDIIRQWMPFEATQDVMVERYLSHATPVDDGMYSHWFRGTGFTNWLKNGIWAPEHNRRAAARDAPNERRSLQQQIEALRREQVNRPSVR